MRVLAVNAGSSSLKLSLLGDAGEDAGRRELEATAGAASRAELTEAIAALGEADAVGHRIVHGGSRFTSAVRITDEVRRELEDLTDLAPLHQPKSLAAMRAVDEALPGLPAVACPDTAFHAGLPDAAATYALPREWRERHGLRRFGFHGLSHAYADRRARELLGRDDARVVVAHLGAGASLAAVRAGRSVDTTMGFTPLEGLVMATRSGSVDPGLLLWLIEHEGMPPHELAEALEHRSGLAGLAGSPDMREVLERSAGGDEDASLALGVYLHRLRTGIGAMTAALGGVDALVFTGGVGERSAAVRARCADGLEHLGVAIDPALNAEPEGDAVIGDGPCPVLVVNAREDREIARQVRRLLGEGAV